MSRGAKGWRGSRYPETSTSRLLAVLPPPRCQLVAKRLLREAMARGTSDNVTCVVVDLQRPLSKSSTANGWYFVPLLDGASPAGCRV